MKPSAKWKQEYLERVRAYTNVHLLDATLGLAAADDYDGCFTDKDQWLFDALCYELDCRLWLTGWSSKPPFSAWGMREP